MNLDNYSPLEIFEIHPLWLMPGITTSELSGQISSTLLLITNASLFLSLAFVVCVLVFSKSYLPNDLVKKHLNRVVKKKPLRRRMYSTENKKKVTNTYTFNNLMDTISYKVNNVNLVIRNEKNRYILRIWSTFFFIVLAIYCILPSNSILNTFVQWTHIGLLIYVYILIKTGLKRENKIKETRNWKKIINLGLYVWICGFMLIVPLITFNQWCISIYGFNPINILANSTGEVSQAGLIVFIAKKPIEIKERPVFFLQCLWASILTTNTTLIIFFTSVLMVYYMVLRGDPASTGVGIGIGKVVAKAVL